MPYSTETKSLLRFSGIDIYARSPSSPITLGKITRQLDLKYMKMSMDKDTCGMLVHSVKGPYICINADHHYVRRRFSVAHEIGHFNLGHDSDVTLRQNRWEETQANKYASCLLMPDELFWFVHKEKSSIKEMARWLRVSSISVAIRCSQFGVRRLESELVMNDYFMSASEMAASKPSSPRQKLKAIQTSPSEEKYKPYKRDEALFSRNLETIDRYRRMYGYE